MKSFYVTLGVGVMLYICTSWILSFVKSADKINPIPVIPISIPADLKVIFEYSCMDCHPTDGKRIAMAKLNFSRWDHYKTDKPSKKTAVIWKMNSQGEMPLMSFRESHPDAIPNASQIDIICKGSETLSGNP
jgi:hypothetical protein